MSSRFFNPAIRPKLPNAAAALYFQAVLIDGLWDLPPQPLRDLQAMAPGELICLIEYLMAQGSISIHLNDDAFSLGRQDEGNTDILGQLEIEAPDFAARVLQAVGREAGMAGLLLQLIKMGALGQWVRTSVRGIAKASGGILTSSNVHFNVRRLAGMGVVAIDKRCYRVDAPALLGLMGAPVYA